MSGNTDSIKIALLSVLEKIAGFRNFLAHDYENVDRKTICESVIDKRVIRLSRFES